MYGEEDVTVSEDSANFAPVTDGSGVAGTF
jgi:hypothetical protein